MFPTHAFLHACVHMHAPLTPLFVMHASEEALFRNTRLVRVIREELVKRVALVGGELVRLQDTSFMNAPSL